MPFRPTMVITALLAMALAACSATDGTAATPTAASSSSAAKATVEATSVGSLGTILVAGSNGMTVYTFTSDQRDSGTSACTGPCLQRWPALTVPAGTAPTAGDGVSGTLGTITRADDASTQVTYNGLPLYFFSGDTKPGDANGVYPGWEAVQP